MIDVCILSVNPAPSLKKIFSRLKPLVNCICFADCPDGFTPYISNHNTGNGFFSAIWLDCIGLTDLIHGTGISFYNCLLLNIEYFVLFYQTASLSFFAENDLLQCV